MRKLFFIAMSLVMSLSVFAQKDSREPGLYYVDGETSTPLTVQKGMTASSGIGILDIVDIGKKKTNYKGNTSDTHCQKAEFVMVIDLEKKSAVQTLKKFDPFYKEMNPDNMKLVQLVVEKKKRVYDEGRSINGIKTKANKSIEFLYEQISDNSWRITADLPAGEYAWIFKPAALTDFNRSAIFDFTIE